MDKLIGHLPSGRATPVILPKQATGLQAKPEVHPAHRLSPPVNYASRNGVVQHVAALRTRTRQLQTVQIVAARGAERFSDLPRHGACDIRGDSPSWCLHERSVPARECCRHVCCTCTGHDGVPQAKHRHARDHCSFVPPPHRVPCFWTLGSGLPSRHVAVLSAVTGIVRAGPGALMATRGTPIIPPTDGGGSWVTPRRTWEAPV